MSHELTIRANGTVEMGYLEGVARWHGLGNELKPGATIEEWTLAAGMEWKALRAFVRYPVSRDDASNPESWRTSKESVVLFRNDTKDELGVVSPKYKPLSSIRKTLFARIF